MKIEKVHALLAVALLFGGVGVTFADQPGISPGPGMRYATDAYPGFDTEGELSSPAKKEPRWFGWLNGPEKDSATEQYAWCREQVDAGSWRAARRGLDALVREWPASPEAPKAQKDLADLYFTHYAEYENAFYEYRYLLDFYSSQCDYHQVASDAYEMAKRMLEEGKTVMFFRFANTVDVRRAFEAVVLRAPGEAFVPEAMLTIASLREDEQKYEQAVTVYENLRNLHPGTPEALKSLAREARARMKLLEMHGYNRERCTDTVNYLKRSLASAKEFEGREDVERWYGEAQARLEDEAFKAVKFYDSNTRTKRSAVSAYENFIRDYPASSHVAEAQARLEVLKGGGQK